MPRWLKIILLALVVAGLGILSLPWWLGAALRPGLKAQGVTFDRYERVGYAHFRLQGVRYAKPGFVLTAGQVQTNTPLVWLGQRLRGAEPAVQVTDWLIERKAGGVVAETAGAGLPRDGLSESRRKAAPTTPESNSPTPPPIAGLPDLHAALQRILPRITSWLPSAHFSNGTLRGFGPDLTIAQARWQNATLTVEGVLVAERMIAFDVAHAAEGSFVLTAHTADNEARLRVDWSGVELKGEAVLWDQPTQLSARFPTQGWLPTEASVVAEKWRLPAARVKLGVPYAFVQGAGRLTWRDGAFDLSLNASAEPAAEAKAPRLEATATAHGNLRELTLTALHVDAPFATANLSAPITFSLDRPLAAESAQLSVSADLSKMPWFEARGQVGGTVTVAGNKAAARQDFELRFTDVARQDFALKSAQANGVLQWPLLELTKLEVQVDDASLLSARGTINWQTRELIDAVVEAKLGPATFVRWLPAGATWANADLSATAEGPLAAPRHEGTLKLDALQWPPLHPLAVKATWLGEGTKLDVSATAKAGTSTLELAGTLDPHGLRLAKVQFAPAGVTVWQLTAPARLSWAPVWQVENLRLAGPESMMGINGKAGAGGSWEIAATRFSSSWLRDWITVTGPGWELRNLQASARVEERALVFDANLAAQIDMSPQPAEVILVARGDRAGVELKDFRVVESGRVLTQAVGRLPVSFVMDPAPQVIFDETAPLKLTASTEPDSPLWATLSAYTGLQLTQPTARLNLQGTLRQPVGELQAKVTRLSLTPGRLKFPLPDVDGLDLALQFGRDAVTVTTLSARLDGQAVQASGQLPMDDAGWQQLWRAPAKFDWKEARARVEIPDADLAPLARRFPKLLAAQGRLRAHVEHAPGGRLTGELHLTEAASRPIPALGSFQDIQADLTLADRVLTVQQMTAKLGGEPLTLAGTVTLAADGTPRLALTLQGTNLPLVRNTGLLLRSDLDLQANTDAAGLTRLSGALTIRDCLVLANLNLQTLLPSGRRGISRQPPYFSVPVDPFRGWPLAVEIRAPSVVRVRTTVYNGVASGFFQLGGTLGEPRAVGQLTVDHGQVLFPFATFKVQQGAVRLREADPFHAIVSLNATSQRRDYQLRLEVTGELPTPNVTITSTPALDAAAVLLMVMTGQPPAGDATATSSSGQRFALLGAYLSRGLFQDLGFSGEDRLEISAGEQVSRQGRETYGFEYKLGERWSLTGEYDEFDAYNAGLRWRVYTEEEPPLEKKK